jgi:hypothetical protein
VEAIKELPRNGKGSCSWLEMPEMVGERRAVAVRVCKKCRDVGSTTRERPRSHCIPQEEQTLHAKRRKRREVGDHG